MQSLARKNEWPLDKVNLTVDVTKKFKEEFNQPAREGAYVYGLYMEGRNTATYFLLILVQLGEPQATSLCIILLVCVLSSNKIIHLTVYMYLCTGDSFPVVCLSCCHNISK